MCTITWINIYCITYIIWLSYTQLMFRFHVNFPGCMLNLSSWATLLTKKQQQKSSKAQLSDRWPPEVVIVFRSRIQFNTQGYSAEVKISPWKMMAWVRRILFLLKRGPVFSVAFHGASCGTSPGRSPGEDFLQDTRREDFISNAGSGRDRRRDRRRFRRVSGGDICQFVGRGPPLRQDWRHGRKNGKLSVWGHKQKTLTKGQVAEVSYFTNLGFNRNNQNNWESTFEVTLIWRHDELQLQ